MSADDLLVVLELLHQDDLAEALEAGRDERAQVRVLAHVAADCRVVAVPRVQEVEAGAGMILRLYAHWTQCNQVIK